MPVTLSLHQASCPLVWGLFQFISLENKPSDFQIAPPSDCPCHCSVPSSQAHPGYIPDTYAHFASISLSVDISVTLFSHLPIPWSPLFCLPKISFVYWSLPFPFFLRFTPFSLLSCWGYLCWTRKREWGVVYPPFIRSVSRLRSCSHWILGTAGGRTVNKSFLKLPKSCALDTPCSSVPQNGNRMTNYKKKLGLVMVQEPMCNRLGTPILAWAFAACNWSQMVLTLGCLCCVSWEPPCLCVTGILLQRKMIRISPRLHRRKHLLWVFIKPSWWLHQGGVQSENYTSLKFPDQKSLITV